MSTAYPAWKKVFDQAAGIRKAAGELQYQLLRDERDANRVVHFSKLAIAGRGPAVLRIGGAGGHPQGSGRSRPGLSLPAFAGTGPAVGAHETMDTLLLFGRTSSHYTRVARMIAHEVDVDVQLVPIHELFSQDAAVSGQIRP